MAWLVRSDGCRLYHETHGDRTREPLLLLEGMGGDFPGWRRNVPHLSAELYVDTVALLDELRLERTHLCGQSFGGMVAQELALAHAERVCTLVLGCTHAGRRQWEAMQSFDAYDRLTGISAPTLVLHGTDDLMIDPENARVLASRVPGAELVLLEGAGHVYHSKQSERADGAVLGFIRRHRDA